MKQNKIHIVRLHKYKNALYRLKSLGFVRVFSDNLADAVGVSSAQVRKDFSLFGLLGSKRGGYVIDDLIMRLVELLGKGVRQEVIVVGAGNIGLALVHYKGFEDEGIKIVAAFDIDPSKIESGTFPVPVLPIDQLADFVKQNDIKIGIIAVPDIAAQQMLNIMIAAGIEGVLNFAPIRLKTPDDFVINNVNLGLELETIMYYVNALGRGKCDEDTNNQN